MTPTDITATSSAQVARDATSLRIGGTCALVGAVAFGIARPLHGDTPGADPAASLTFVATRPIYAGVHITTVFAALPTVAGLISMAGTFAHPIAWALGRLGSATSLVGLAIFGVESTSEGLALPELAAASASASPDQQAELVRAAHAVLAVTHGPSLVAVAFLFGITLILFGTSLTYDIYPSWLGWIGIMIGVATLIAATGGLMVGPEQLPEPTGCCCSRCRCGSAECADSAPALTQPDHRSPTGADKQLSVELDLVVSAARWGGT